MRRVAVGLLVSLAAVPVAAQPAGEPEVPFDAEVAAMLAQPGGLTADAAAERAAKTSPERTWGHRSTQGIPQDGVVPAWEYEWLVEAPEVGSSWVRPLDVRRRSPLPDHAAAPRSRIG